MKSIVVLCLLFVGSFCLMNSESLLLDLFKQWKLTYNKFYASPLEESHRFEAFIQNYITVQEYNSKQNSVTLALNEFADLTSEEFSQFYTGLIVPSQSQGSETFVFDTKDLPSSVDWRESGAVTEVKNQGVCGSCWAFSAVGALEGLYFINNTQLISFSEQNLVNCVKGDHGCLGGWPIDALSYSAQKGIESEEDYPYKGWLQLICTFDASKAYTVNSGYYNVTPSDKDQLKAAVAGQPVSVAIQANQRVFQLYKSGVIQKDCGAKLDHGVLAVGYDTYNGVEAYIIKNSWGAKWGDNGYVLVSTDGSANDGLGVCGILSVPAIPYKK